MQRIRVLRFALQHFTVVLLGLRQISPRDGAQPPAPTSVASFRHRCAPITELGQYFQCGAIRGLCAAVRRLGSRLPALQMCAWRLPSPAGINQLRAQSQAHPARLLRGSPAPNSPTRYPGAGLRAPQQVTAPPRQNAPLDSSACAIKGVSMRAMLPPSDGRRRNTRCDSLRAHMAIRGVSKPGCARVSA